MIREDLYGRGISYPFRFERGRVAHSKGVEKVNDSLRLLFDVGENEVFMSDIGSRVNKLAFISDENVFEALAEAYILDVIYEHEPRIEQVVSLTFDWKDSNTVNINLVYKLIGSPVEHNFVYPFKTM